MGGSELTPLPHRGGAAVTKGGSVCHPELCPRVWLTTSRPGVGGGVGDGGEVGGSVYLRKYQASSTPRSSSSRDRTSTVGRMCWLGDVTKEEGEAEPRGQGAPSTKKQEDREGARSLADCIC